MDWFNRKSVLKTVSWRFVATGSTVLLAFFIFGRLDLALSLGAAETVAKTFLYYAHERVWS